MELAPFRLDGESTSFEHMMVGGSARDTIPLDGSEKAINLIHTPRNIVDGKSTPEKMNQYRPEGGFYVFNPMALGFFTDFKEVKMKDDPELDGVMIAVSREPIDPESGIAIRDPKILGVYDKETGEIKQIEGRDLNHEWLKMQEEWVGLRPDDTGAKWNYLRDCKKSYLETESPRDPEKE